MPIHPNFETIFGHRPEYLFSAPGRTELSGNHTDHQHGRVLAAAVNLEALGWVARSGSGRIRVVSEGHSSTEISITELEKRPEEANRSVSLLRGVAARFHALGAELSGLDIYTTNSVMTGSGLSSSAAYEVLLGTIFNHLFCGGRFTPVQIAQIGQWAENEYFGKPCGLMDQTASSVGGIIGIDFADPAAPVVEKIDFDFAACGHALCIIDVGADHADLTGEYAAIPGELKQVCRVFGKNWLRDVDEAEFYARIAEVRKAAGDRAVLRAIHIFEENKRVERQLAALKSGDFDEFLRGVRASGLSSLLYLQNVTPAGYTDHQEAAFALALAEHLLDGRGACRIHGGGFAGTIQAFVPNDLLDEFKAGIDTVLGAGSCKVLSIRQEGGILVEAY